MLTSLVICLKHSSSMAVLLAVESLQARRESAIDKSKILADSAKDKLRTVCIAAESLFRLLKSRNLILNLSNSFYCFFLSKR